MINFHQFKEYVVVPTLQYLDSKIPYTEEAVDLLMMTCAHESKGGKYLRQVGMTEDRGAFGVYQMEMATHGDIYANFLNSRSELVFLLDAYVPDRYATAHAMMSDLAYATAMARVHYWRVKEPLPKKDDSGYLDKLGKYAKLYYNTPLGKATPSKYVTDYLEWRDS